MVSWLALVDDNHVPRGIGHQSHVAHRRLEGLHDEGDSGLSGERDF